MGNVSKSFYRDLKAARRRQRKDAATITATVVVERLTKAGVPSKMAGERQYFADRAAADAYVANLRQLNPTRDLQFRITEV